MVDHFHQHAVVIDHLTGLRITAETHCWVSEMMYPGRLNQGGKIQGFRDNKKEGSDQAPAFSALHSLVFQGVRSPNHTLLLT